MCCSCVFHSSLCVWMLTFTNQVHWFPRHISELDLIANRTLDAGVDLQSDHPGFNDVEYRNRRALLAEKAMKYRMGMELPTTDYSEDEVETWGVVWDKMEGLLEKVCTIYRNNDAFWSLYCLVPYHLLFCCISVCLQRVQGKLVSLLLSSCHYF